MSLILRKSSTADNARQYATLRRLELLNEELLGELRAQTLALSLGTDSDPDKLRRDAAKRIR